MNFFKLIPSLVLVVLLTGCASPDKPFKNQDEPLNSKIHQWVVIDTLNYIDQNSIEDRKGELYYIGYFAGKGKESPLMTIRSLDCVNGVRKIYKSTEVKQDGFLVGWLSEIPIIKNTIDHDTPTISKEYKEYKKICK